MTEALVELIDGRTMSELAICEPLWLYAGRLTDAATGESWRYTYASPVVKRGSKLHQSMVSWLDGASQTGEAEVRTDPEMMRGEGVLTLWED